jgi:hypothetical protein
MGALILISIIKITQMLQGDLVASYFTKLGTRTSNLTFLRLNMATKRPHSRCWFTLAIMDGDALTTYAKLILMAPSSASPLSCNSLVKRSTCHMGRRNLRREWQGQLLDLIDRLVLGTMPLVHGGVT